ncbi:MAG: 6,7-dimethyl-8-ribityllumazine synthase [Pseudolabrys sp.]|nr:6,7-dimethyl-8-ribityllumazine synthase [Pseudolabrys sp.]
MVQRHSTKPAKIGKGSGRRAHVLIVEARYYEAIADQLLAGASQALKDANTSFDVITVPGSLEIPAAIAIGTEAAQRKKQPYDGAVALGCVIRGDTLHFEIVAEQSARALMDFAVAQKLPLGNGILTVDTNSQAEARANPEEGNKGGEAARATLALIGLKRELAKR